MGLARAVRVPPNRISAIVNGERGSTADGAYGSPIVRSIGSTCKSSTSSIVRAMRNRSCARIELIRLGFDRLPNAISGARPITLLALRASVITVTTSSEQRLVQRPVFRFSRS